MNLNDLETFIFVAEEGTFSGAAERLGVPKSTVSRRVGRLEEDLGIALLVRSSRSIALSDDGRALAERCAPALREIVEVERGLGDSAGEPRGTLRVTAPIDLGTSPILGALIADYRLKNPEVRVELDVTNRRVDLLEESFDLAFRFHRGALDDRADLMMRLLAEVPLGLYASPRYLEENDRPGSYDELIDHPVVAHVTDLGLSWTQEPVVVTNDYGPVAAMLAAGAGVGGMPSFVASPLIEAGQLERIELSDPCPNAKLSLIWLRSRHLAPRVRAFIDLVTSRSESFQTT